MATYIAFWLHLVCINCGVHEVYTVHVHNVYTCILHVCTCIYIVQFIATFGLLSGIHYCVHVYTCMCPYLYIIQMCIIHVHVHVHVHVHWCMYCTCLYRCVQAELPGCSQYMYDHHLSGYIYMHKPLCADYLLPYLVSSH